MMESYARLVQQAAEGSNWQSNDLGKLVRLVVETEGLRPKALVRFLGETCAAVMTADFMEELGTDALGGERAPGRIVKLLRESTRGRSLLIERLAAFAEAEYLPLRSPATVQSIVDLVDSHWELDDTVRLADRLCSCCIKQPWMPLNP